MHAQATSSPHTPREVPEGGRGASCEHWHIAHSIPGGGASPQHPTKGKRGAPFGNSNALRHGFYSRHFNSAENAGLDSDIKCEFIDEINIARINVLRLAELLKDHKNMSIADHIAAANGLRHFLECIRSLSREQKFMYQNMTTIEQALEELKDLSPYED